jgi:hypothetical protein
LTLSHATHRFCGPSLTVLGLALAANTPVHSTVFALSLVVTVNGLVHTWDYSYEQSLTRDSDIVALLAARPNGAHLADISHAMGTRPLDTARSLFRLLRKGLVTLDENVPVNERLWRLAA